MRVLVVVLTFVAFAESTVGINGPLHSFGISQASHMYGFPPNPVSVRQQQLRNDHHVSSPSPSQPRALWKYGESSYTGHEMTDEEIAAQKEEEQRQKEEQDAQKQAKEEAQQQLEEQYYQEWLEERKQSAAKGQASVENQKYYGYGETESANEESWPGAQIVGGDNTTVVITTSGLESGEGEWIVGSSALAIGLVVGFGLAALLSQMHRSKKKNARTRPLMEEKVLTPQKPHPADMMV